MRTAGVAEKPRKVIGRDMYLGYAPPPDDPLPEASPRFGALFSSVPPPNRLVIRVRTEAEFRVWLAMARPGDRAIYFKGRRALIADRELDPFISTIAHEALRQSTVKDSPVKSPCRHVRGRLNGIGRVSLHSETLPWGQGVFCYCIRLDETSTSWTRR